MLLRKVRAYRPAQTFDEFTGEAWAEALHDIRLIDASQAVTDYARRSSGWIDPAVIITEVRRIRAERVRVHGLPIPPAGMTVAEEITWTRAALTLIGDGETVEGRGVHYELDTEPRTTGSMKPISELVGQISREHGTQ